MYSNNTCYKIRGPTSTMARLIRPSATGRIKDSSGTRRFGIQPKPPTLSSMYVTIAAKTYIKKKNSLPSYC
jgi:hypothetical protein